MGWRRPSTGRAATGHAAKLGAGIAVQTCDQTDCGAGYQKGRRDGWSSSGVRMSAGSSSWTRADSNPWRQLKLSTAARMTRPSKSVPEGAHAPQRTTKALRGSRGLPPGLLAEQPAVLTHAWHGLHDTLMGQEKPSDAVSASSEVNGANTVPPSEAGEQFR